MEDKLKQSLAWGESSNNPIMEKYYFIVICSKEPVEKLEDVTSGKVKAKILPFSIDKKNTIKDQRGNDLLERGIINKMIQEEK